MKTIAYSYFAAGLAAFLFFTTAATAQNLPCAHWINDSGQSAESVMSGGVGATFITNFKGHNDLTLKNLTSDSAYLYSDNFGGASPGNNPWYLTQFIGVSTNGTGNGSAGNVGLLEMSRTGSGSLQFDFQNPLTPHDRILIADIDGTEVYSIQAYTYDGANYSSASVANWNFEVFSGQTGQTPDNTWPLWNAGGGTLTSRSPGNLNEELCVLTPDQNIARLIITKEAGSGYSTEVQFITPLVPLTIQTSGANVVVSWPVGFPNLTLDSTDNLANGSNNWSPVSGTPITVGNYWYWTNAITGTRKFYTLGPQP